MYYLTSYMLEDLSKVSDFHKIAGIEPSLDAMPLQRKMLISELEEYNEADTLHEIVDGIGDVYYLYLGGIYHTAHHAAEYYLRKTVTGLLHELDTILAMTPYNSHDVFNIIHEANLTKFCRTEESAIISCNIYKEMGVTVHYEMIEHKGEVYYVLKVAEDVTLPNGKQFPKGKVMKSHEFKEPNFDFIISYLTGDSDE